MVDPNKVEIPRLKFGKPETADQFREAMVLKKKAAKASTRMECNRQSLESRLKDIQVRIKAGTLSNRCPCGKFPWEHRGEKCGPRNAYRKARLLKLYMKRPARSLEGSNSLARKAIS